MTQSQPNPTLGRLLVGIGFGWLLLATFLPQLLGWAGPVLGLDGGSSAAAFLTALSAGLVALPLLGASRLLPPSRWRAALESWMLAALVPLVLAPTRLIAPADSQLQALAQTGGLLLLALLWRPRMRTPAQGESLALAAAAAALLALPWLASGALGSALDTLLALANGLLAGTIAARTTERWAHAAETDGLTRGGLIWRGAFVAGTVLLVVASGLAGNGVQLMLMLAVPALGMAMTALGIGRDRRTWQAPALLAGLALAAPLALLDSDSIGIVALDQALGRAFGAAVLAAMLGWALGGAALFWRGRWGNARLALPLAGLAALVLAGAGLVYATAGRPGLYGDRLFVVLRSQADLSQAAAITDYDQRRSVVYNTLTDHASQTQAELRAHLARFGIESTPYYLVNAVEVRGGLLARLLLLGRGEVERVMPSPVMRPIEPPQPLSGSAAEVPAGEPRWNLTSIGAEQVWQEFGARGQGIVIGQSDSGAQWDHPELRDSYRGVAGDHEYNWLDPWTGSAAPVDGGGHGTHTLGSVLGNTVGVAPDATWFACANLQRNLGNPALYLDCMQFMLAPYAPGGDPLRDGNPLRSAHVLNNSWGCPQEFEGCDPESLKPAVDNLAAAGIFVVASAGNDGPECSSVSAPIAIYENAFSVGAIDQAGDLASFSSTGPVTVDGSGRTKPDILAPGVDVYSSLPGDTYGENSGTSMAGPHVAGVVALLWSANPALIGDIAQTRQILAETARPFNGELAALLGEAGAGSCLAETDLQPRPNNIAGYGVVDAYAAVQRAVEMR